MGETLTIHHQDGPLVYDVAPERETGFAVAGDELHLSVRSECREPQQWPTVFFVGGHMALAGDALAPGRVLEAGSAAARAWVYYGERAHDVALSVRVLAASANELVVNVEVTTDDVLYAGARARPSLTSGQVTLPRLSLDDVWRPPTDE